ncbi:hypothetical protein BB559_004337 [Furculomyces boomerangus]|uniref:Uncharacterized protein n=1 Tax=Furculomyces boomerangus TaxID=61424 RepID=A0A2T9YFD6_9FUNG|nr:hypothetical protein BB559_004337 [Furculomyces boomerangus]
MSNIVSTSTNSPKSSNTIHPKFLKNNANATFKRNSFVSPRSPKTTQSLLREPNAIQKPQHSTIQTRISSLNIQKPPPQASLFNSSKTNYSSHKPNPQINEDDLENQKNLLEIFKSESGFTSNIDLEQELHLSYPHSINSIQTIRQDDEWLMVSSDQAENFESCQSNFENEQSNFLNLIPNENDSSTSQNLENYSLDQKKDKVDTLIDLFQKSKISKKNELDILRYNQSQSKGSQEDIENQINKLIELSNNPESLPQNNNNESDHVLFFSPKNKASPQKTLLKSSQLPVSYKNDSLAEGSNPKNHSPNFTKETPEKDNSSPNFRNTNPNRNSKFFISPGKSKVDRKDSYKTTYTNQIPTTSKTTPTNTPSSSNKSSIEIKSNLSISSGVNKNNISKNGTNISSISIKSGKSIIPNSQPENNQLVTANVTTEKKSLDKHTNSIIRKQPELKIPHSFERPKKVEINTQKTTLGSKKQTTLTTTEVNRLPNSSLTSSRKLKQKPTNSTLVSTPGKTLKSTEYEEKTKNIMSTIKKLQSENSRLESIVTRTKSEIISIKSDAEKGTLVFQTEIQNLKNEMETERKALKSELDDHILILETKNKMIKNLEEQIRLKEIENSIKVQEMVQGHDILLNTIQKAHENLHSTAKQTETECKELRKNVDRLSTELDKKKNEVLSLSKDLDSRTQSINLLENQIKDLENSPNIENYEKRISTLTSERDGILAELNRYSKLSNDFEHNSKVENHNAILTKRLRKFSTHVTQLLSVVNELTGFPIDIELNPIFENDDTLTNFLSKQNVDSGKEGPLDAFDNDNEKFLKSLDELIPEIREYIKKNKVENIQKFPKIPPLDSKKSRFSGSLNLNLPLSDKNNTSFINDRNTGYQGNGNHIPGGLKTEHNSLLSPSNYEFTDSFNETNFENSKDYTNTGNTRNFPFNTSPRSSEKYVFNNQYPKNTPKSAVNKSESTFTMSPGTDSPSDFSSAPDSITKTNRNKHDSLPSSGIGLFTGFRESVTTSPMLSGSNYRSSIYKELCVDGMPSPKILSPDAEKELLEIKDINIPVESIINNLKANDNDSSLVLDMKLKRLTHEKSRIQSELARIPQNANYKARIRKQELEELMFTINGHISGVRLRFRHFINQ